MDDLWLRAFHPAPERPMKLVCLPHAGGSASSWFALSAAIDSVAEVIGVQYPGRQDRWKQPPVSDLLELADQVAGVLLDQLSEPIALLGHSMGSALGFEVTRRLERAGKEPVRLFVSGSRAASLPRTDRIHESDDQGFVDELTRLGGTDPRLLNDREMLNIMLPAIRADYTAIESYCSTEDAQVNCPVTVLTGDADPTTNLAQAQAWARHTTAGCDMRIYPGGHFYLVDVVPQLAEDITKALVAE